jgi:hopanoid C-3 methylase
MKKKKILLATPPYHPYNLADEKIYITEPLQFEILASLLDENLFEVEVLDLRLERGKNVFLNKIKKYRPDIFGMTSWTMHVNSVLELFKTAKSVNPAIKTVVGGHHTYISPSDFSYQEVDFIMAGESYSAFATLLNRISNGDGDVSDLKGVAYQKDGKFYYNGQGVITSNFDLDSLPFPNREVVSKYLPDYFHLWWKPVASFRTAIGCPSKCSFCNLWKANLGKYLTWSPEYIADYLETLDEPYVFIVDDHFFGDIQRAREIAEIILKRNIKKEFCIYTRSDAITENPDIIKLWSKVGLKRVRMGLETYSDQQLSLWDKKNTIENNDQAIAILKKHNILTEGLFIIGLDFTNKEFSAMKEYILSRKIEVPNITVYCPMPGTPDFQKQKNNMIYKDFEYFDFQHAVLQSHLDLKTYCREYGKLLISVQRPPLEQIKIIGIKNFVKRIPSFWRYFLSVRNSHTHYKKDRAFIPANNSQQRKSQSMPWEKSTVQ